MVVCWPISHAWLVYSDSCGITLSWPSCKCATCTYFSGPSRSPLFYLYSTLECESELQHERVKRRAADATVEIESSRRNLEVLSPDLVLPSHADRGEVHPASEARSGCSFPDAKAVRPTSSGQLQVHVLALHRLMALTPSWATRCPPLANSGPQPSFSFTLPLSELHVRFSGSPTASSVAVDKSKPWNKHWDHGALEGFKLAHTFYAIRQTTLSDPFHTNALMKM